MCSLPHSAPPVNFDRFDPAVIAHRFNTGLTQWTAVQILMALDTWHAAHDELNALIDRKTAGIEANYLFRSPSEHNLMGEIYNAVCDCQEVCPMEQGKQLARHSHEMYPVDRTLRSAAAIRNAIKRVQKLEA